jgi:hypothetical protein
VAVVAAPVFHLVDRPVAAARAAQNKLMEYLLV